MTDRGSAKENGTRLEEKLCAQIDAAASVNVITTQEMLAEVADLKSEVRRLCRAGDGEKARRLAELAVSRLRTGEAPKE